MIKVEFYSDFTGDTLDDCRQQFEDWLFNGQRANDFEMRLVDTFDELENTPDENWEGEL